MIVHYGNHLDQEQRSHCIEAAVSPESTKRALISSGIIMEDGMPIIQVLMHL